MLTEGIRRRWDFCCSFCFLFWCHGANRFLEGDPVAESIRCVCAPAIHVLSIVGLFDATFWVKHYSLEVSDKLFTVWVNLQHYLAVFVEADPIQSVDAKRDWRIAFRNLELHRNVVVLHLVQDHVVVALLRLVRPILSCRIPVDPNHRHMDGMGHLEGFTHFRNRTIIKDEFFVNPKDFSISLSYKRTHGGYIEVPNPREGAAKINIWLLSDIDLVLEGRIGTRP